jgi:hypothetical protein
MPPRHYQSGHHAGVVMSPRLVSLGLNTGATLENYRS